MLIQKLRLKRGWSQQQLADASGLSVRTIQRIENGQTPSVETLKSLAAVFEVDFSTLNPEEAVNPSTREEEEAFRYVRKLRRFYVHLFQYLVVCGGLAVINFVFVPHYKWVYWVMAGWGIGLASHAFMVFRPRWFLGPQWERTQVEKRLGRPL